MKVMGKLSMVAKEALAEAFGHLLDGGSIWFYDGDMPQNSGDEITGQRRLARVPLADPAFRPIKNGVMQNQYIGVPAKATATGRMRWCRCCDREDKPIIDGDVGVGPGFFCDVASDYIEVGGTVLINSIVYRI